MTILNRAKNLKNTIFRKIPIFNKIENRKLTMSYMERINKIKKNNAEAVFTLYYLPKAITAILKEDNYLTSPLGAYDRAQKMMTIDIYNGVLDEFYKFKN